MTITLPSNPAVSKLTDLHGRRSATGTSGCEAGLTGPRGDSPGTITARGTVQYAATPATVVIDGLGQPAAGQTIQVSGAAQTITIEAVTGYVHD